MRLLSELVTVFRSRPGRTVKLLRGQSRAMDLYNLISADGAASDEEAQRRLYGQDEHAGRYLYDVKRDLLDRLVNTLLCLPGESGETKTMATFAACAKEWALIQQMRGRTERTAAVALAERTLKRALKYQHTEIVLSLARFLLQHYSSIEVDHRKFQEYARMADEYGRLAEAERRTELLFGEVSIRQTLTKSQAGKLPQIKAYTDEVRELMEKYPRAYRLNLLGFNLLTNLGILRNDHQAVVATCRRAVDFFNQLPYPPSAASFFIFNYRMIPSQIQLGDYAAARQSIATCLNLSRPGTHNYGATLFYQMVLGFYSGDYELASEGLSQAKELRISSPTLREHLLIAEAYIAFLRQAGYLQRSGNSFRPGRFLNEVPVYSKDKRGMNINILILQALFLLLNRRYDKIIDRTEALAMYTHRYLRRDENFRSNCFINLLLLLPKNSFHPRAVERKAKPLLDKLATAPQTADYDVEIVPYPVLWGVVRELLEKQ